MNTRLIYSRGNKLYTDVYRTEGGRRVRKRVATGFNVGQESLALVVAARLQAGESMDALPVGETRWGTAEARKALEVLTLGTATKLAWTKWATLKDQRHKVSIGREVLGHFGADTPLRDIDAGKIQQWVTRLLEQDIAVSTVNRKLAWLSALLRFHVNTGAIESMPRFPRLKERPVHRTPLTAAQVAAVIAAEADPWHQDLLVFLRDTRCRVDEALGLQWTEVGQGTVTFADTKAGDNRTLPLTDAAAAVLARSRARSEPPGSTRPFPMAYRTVWSRFRAAARTAGVDIPVGSALHLFRHSTATQLLQAGAGVRDVQVWLGHKHVTTTERYAKVTGTALQGVMARLQGLQGLQGLQDPQDPSAH